MNWLMLQKLEHREQRIVLEELLGAVRQESERVERLEQAIRDAVPEWSLAEVVTALQAMRGIDLITAVTEAAAHESGKGLDREAVRVNHQRLDTPARVNLRARPSHQARCAVPV